MRRLIVVALPLLLLSAAHAADQAVLGTVLTVKNPSTATRRKVIVKAKETASDDTLVGDPVTNGATVTITLNGANPSEVTYSLPAGTDPTTQKPYWSGDVVRGFKYRDRDGDNGPVKMAQIKLRNGVFRLKVVVDGKRGPVTLLPPDPGTDGCVLFGIAGGDSYSLQFADGKLKNKGSALFKVAKPTSEGICATAVTPAATATPSATATPTATAAPTLDLPNIPPPGAAPLRYRDLVFSNVTTTSNVVYGSAVNLSGQTVTLLLDVYEPTGDPVTERPAIVWVHGGSFCCGSKTSAEIVDEATTFARKGYFNVSISYRLEPGGCTGSVPISTCLAAIQEALDDAQTASRFLRDNAALYGIDETRIAIGGSSAGAVTALNVGFSSVEDPTAAVGGAVSLSGFRVYGAVDPDDAPSLLFHGTSDTVVSYASAFATWEQAVAAGIDSFLTTWTGSGSGHVPYSQHRTEILDQTTNFLYWELDLANAAQ
jgi:acetyl esterase/lipase